MEEFNKMRALLKDIERRNGKQPTMRHEKEFNLIALHLALVGKYPTNGEMAQAFNHEFTRQNYSLILAKFKKLFPKK